MKKIALVVACLSLVSGVAFAAKIGSVDTEVKVIGANHSIEVESLKDSDIDGMTCHLSYSKSGGMAGAIGAATESDRFSITCRQTGPLVIRGDLNRQVEVKSVRRNPFFKEMMITRMFDKENNTLIYLVHNQKTYNTGSSFNAISSVPLMPWGTKEAVLTAK